MTSTGFCKDLDAQGTQRTKEENQERAFVAASRRKDRSLDARLESANRASMLHKKRTGKALRITKEIVESEAMYEEVDERNHEKRLDILNAHNRKLESQFEEHIQRLCQAHSHHARSRLSATGGIRKMHINVASAQPYRPQRSQHSISPTATSPSDVDATSPTYSLYSSAQDSYFQSPKGFCMPTSYSPYLPQEQMSGFVPQQLGSTTWDSTQQLVALQQSLNSLSSLNLGAGQMAPMTQMASPQSSLPSRQRVASVPDALLFQQQQYAAPSMSDASRAQSEPFIPGPSPDSNAERLMPVLSNDGSGLSSPPMTVKSSESSPHDAYSPVVEQDASFVIDKGPMLGVDEVPGSDFDPEYADFLDFSTTLEDQWQLPVTDSCYEDWGYINTMDYDLPVAGV